MRWKRVGFRFCYLFCSWLLSDSSGFSDFGYLFSFHGVCRGLPGSSLLFFCFAKSKASKRKGDPQSGSLRFAPGNFRCSKSAEFLETSLLRSRRTPKNLFPLPPALLSPARTGGEMHAKTDSGMPSHGGRGRKSDPAFLPNPVLAGLEKAVGDGSKNLDVRRR